MTPTISIIVPCYNAAKSIKRTISSVLQQSYTQWELILVNDGSGDETAAHIRSFSDSRIRLLEQENKGASSARNNGMRHAKGEWLCFLDSDDSLLPWALECLVSALDSSTDIIAGCHRITLSDDKAELQVAPVKIARERLAANTLFWQKHEQSIIDDVFAGLPTRHRLNLGAPWAKLYRKAFLDKHKLHFNEELVLHEDTLFNHMAYTHAQSVSILPIPVYCYLDNPNSLTRGQNKKYREHCIAALRQFCQLHPDYPEELCYFAMFHILECWQSIRSENSHKRSSQLQQLRDFLQNPEINALVSRMPIKGNHYFNTYDKTELLLLKNKQLFLLVYLMPIIRHLRHLKNRLIRG